MATITVRDLPDEVRDALKARARARGRSMEAEARAVLSEAVVDIFRPPIGIEVDPGVWADPANIPAPGRPGRIDFSKLEPHRLRTAASVEELLEDDKGEW